MHNFEISMQQGIKREILDLYVQRRSYSTLEKEVKNKFFTVLTWSNCRFEGLSVSKPSTSTYIISSIDDRLWNAVWF